jgi:hypothetical protein
MAITAVMYGQAKKPTLMVMPSEVWCLKNNFYITSAGEKIADYKKAVQEDADLLNVTTKIGELMAERGFPLKDLSSTIRDIERSNVENEMTTSRRSNAALDETPLERIMNRAKADIIVEVLWSINTTGPKHSVTYNMRGIDAYTNKQIAAAQGTGAPSFSAEVPVLLEEAVLTNMDSFLAQLQMHFDDIAENGREVSVNVRVFDTGAGISMIDEFNGEELTDIIDNWMADNTVNHRYNLSDAGDTHLMFEQVRIPLYRTNGRPMDTREFVNDLRKFLSKPPYNLTSKVSVKGLGRAELLIGDK